MNRKSITLFCLLASGLFSHGAFANELLLGAKAGIFDLDFKDAGSEDPFAASTIMVGYEFLDLAIVDIGFELDFTSSLTEGEVGGQDYSYQGLGGLFSVRTAGPIYFVGRAGYVDSEVDPEIGSTIDDSATQLGVGIGFSTGLRWELQLESLQYHDRDDDAMYLNVGLSF
jgi:hypothetical protein